MLDSVSLVFRVRLSQQPDDNQQLCAASLFRFLLASNVQRDGQSDYLLLDEQQVSATYLIFIKLMKICFDYNLIYF